MVHFWSTFGLVRTPDADAERRRARDATGGDGDDRGVLIDGVFVVVLDCGGVPRW